MRAVFDKGELLVLLRDFYELTGLRTVVFDEWGMDILSYPQQLPDYCRLVRATPQGEMGCRLCDQKACRQARQEKTTWIYPCHAGLIEAITPIQIDGVVVGYLLLSHIVQGTDEQAEWQRAWQLCAGYPIRQEELYRAYRQLPRTPYQRLRAACDLLALSARALCQVHMARTALYQLSKETYGCGINESVRRLRIQRAIRLLTTTRLTNNQICQQIGIADYNYFFRVFRRQTGFTPQAYRRQFSGTD